MATRKNNFNENNAKFHIKEPGISKQGGKQGD